MHIQCAPANPHRWEAVLKVAGHEYARSHKSEATSLWRLWQRIHAVLSRERAHEKTWRQDELKYDWQHHRTPTGVLGVKLRLKLHEHRTLQRRSSRYQPCRQPWLLFRYLQRGTFGFLFFQKKLWKHWFLCTQLCPWMLKYTSQRQR